MKRTERLAGTVERFVCGSGGRVEVSKCRAVLGPAFAGVGRELGGRGDDGVRLCGVVSVGPGRWAGLRKRSEAPLVGEIRKLSTDFSSFILINRDLLNKLRTI